MSLLIAKNITKTYEVGDNEIKALDNVSMEIKKGEFLAIIGKSGSGKSTLMHILGLLDSPTSGELYINDQKVNDIPPNKLSKIRNKEIGFIFQAFYLLPRVNCIENVMLALQYSQLPLKTWKTKAIDMLNLVGLGSRLYNKSNELSGGQKQRVAIARALVTDPSIIFADEPTGNLDSKTGSDIMNLLMDLNKNGKTIVLVTHDLELAKIANRQLIIADGKIQL